MTEIENEDFPINIPIYLSEKDLELLDSYYDDIENSDPDMLGKILFKHGFNTSLPVEIVNDTHRCRTSNKVHTGKRFVGYERQDNNWRQSGLMTLETLMAISDKETRKDMFTMSRRSKVENAENIETMYVG